MQHTSINDNNISLPENSRLYNIISKKYLLNGKPIETKEFIALYRSDKEKKAMATYQALANLHAKYPQDIKIKQILDAATQELIEVFS